MVAAFASARERLGQTLNGKYEIEEVLGTGGTAVVFRARVRDGGAADGAGRVAVKILHDHLATSSDIRRRFMREAYLANKLNHPCTVRVLDDGETEDGTAFLVLELLDGETLDERCHRAGGGLPLRDVLCWIDTLLAVLEVAHAQNVVHRDIKPSNIFIMSDGSVKVLDFGIARILDDVGGATATKTGTMMGTPAFMPPEQALSKPREIDAQSDLWAVGATMFTLLSGQLVHVAESSSEHLVKAATLHARSLAKVLPGVPDRVEALVAKALAFHKKDRWTSASEMRRALADVRANPGRPIGTPSRPPPRRNPMSDAPTLIRRSDRPSRDTTDAVTREMPLGRPGKSTWMTLAALVAGVAMLLVGVLFAARAAFERGIDRTASAATAPVERAPMPPPVATTAMTEALDAPAPEISSRGVESPAPAAPATEDAPKDEAEDAPPARITAKPPRAKRRAEHTTSKSPPARKAKTRPASSADLYRPF